MSKYNMKLDKDQIKTLCKLENVIGQLVNIDVNPSWLSNIPHREFLDSMYIVYRLDATCIFGDGFRETKTMYPAAFQSFLPLPVCPKRLWMYPY